MNLNNLKYTAVFKIRIMKKLFILLSYFFISLNIPAQKTPVKNNPNDIFCNTLLKVIAQSSSQFEKLKTGGYLAFLNPKAGGWVGNGWVASINFPGAFLSNIEQVENGPNTYNAYFGNYPSEADARKEAGIIKNKVSACLPGYTIEDRAYMENSFQGFPINFFFIEKKKGTSPQQIINLCLARDSSIYNIYLRIIGSDVNGAVLQSIMTKPVTEDSRNVQTNFAKQMEQLLGYAKDGFKAIKGEEIEQPKNSALASILLGEKNLRKYRSEFRPEGFNKGAILYYPDIQSTKFIASYDYFILPEFYYRDLFDKMKKELGNDFTYETDEESIRKDHFDKSQKVVFYRKDSKQSHLELIYNSEPDAKKNGMPDGILLVVEALKSQSTVLDNKSDNHPATKNNYDKIINIYTTGDDDLCKRLSEIMIHAHTNFEKITTEEQQIHEDQKEGDDALKLIAIGFKTSLKFPGAKLSSVNPGFGGPDSYEAYFGSYQTLDQAAKIIDSIKIRLAGCLKGYKVEKKSLTEDSDKYLVSYIFDEKRTDKSPPHHLTLIIEKDLDWGDEDAKEVFKIYLYIYGLRPV